MGLARYRSKRNFTQTAEPSGPARRAKKQRKSAELSFVVQQHHASRPHFDFRLELDGVLKSWAVPKGPSLDPADKRLAVEVEDHPLEYASFEGTIPQGEYGGGSVIVWDRGTWEPQEEDPARALKRGSLKITLHGEKLRGNWALVRMADKPGDTKHNWLLIKERDRYVKPRASYDITLKKPKSVISGKKIEQIGAPKSTSRARGKAPRPRARKKARSRRTADTSGAADLPGARPGRAPSSFRPQLATLVDRVPPGDDWRHEVKFDGYRLLAFFRDAEVRLVTRKGNDWTAKFPETRDALESFGFNDGVLDGEIVALGDNGISSFQGLQRVLKEGRTGELVYFVFDVPFWGGSDLTACTLADRRAFLGSVLATPTPRVRLSAHIDGHGDDVLRNACRLHLEGIVSKRADSHYTSGRTTSWVKTKCTHRQELVIAGYTEPKGSRAGLGALLVGYLDDDERLIYAGKVGAGFDAADLDSLAPRLKRLERDSSPLANPPRAPALHWVDPKLVAEIAFSEWTADGRLRHPVFLGLRQDKEASEVKREAPRSARPRKRRVRSAHAPKPSPTGEAAVAGVRISSPERVAYPGEGITKLEIARYYESVAEQILPHLSNRPLSLVRCPEGRSGECFFQKHLEVDGVRGLQSVPIEESSKTTAYAAVSALPGLIHLVQMNTLELHAWGSRADNVERPDRLVFDLDPGDGAPWRLVVDGARRLRGLFEAADLRSFVMTTGGKGLHVVIPVQRRLDWDVAKAFARSVASALAADAPDKFVANMSKAKRRGKVFIDYLRIQRGATSVVPYSTRARPHAPVAMPIEWDDIDKTRPDAFTVRNAPEHIASRRRDPWEKSAQLRQSIPAALLPAAGA